MYIIWGSYYNGDSDSVGLRLGQKSFLSNGLTGDADVPVNEPQFQYQVLKRQGNTQINISEN